jgi:ubiquinone/menaquinone biosynthesis C-methylase UbiE
VNHYLSELSRVLAPGGKCLATFFLMNEEARQLIASRRSSLDLSHTLSGCWTANPRVPETAIGCEESEVVRLLGDNGFTVYAPSYGKWCGREEYQSYQDILVFRKV